MSKRTPRRIETFFQVVLIAVVAIIPVLSSLSSAGKTAYRDTLDIFLNSVNFIPLIPIFPLVITLIAVLPFFQRISERHLVSERMRKDTVRMLVQYLVRACAVAGMAFFLYIVVAGAFAFAIAPQLSIYQIDPAAYGLTNSDAVFANSLGRSTFTSLLSAGPIVFVLVFALWMAAVAALFAALSMAFVLLIRSRVLALLASWIIYLGETIFAAILLSPSFAVAYAVFPSGLRPLPPLEFLIPIGLLLLGTIVLWTSILRRPERAYGLT